jgi:methionyl-tRNA formyltransferase
MRIVFLGTPDFAAHHLEVLVEAGLDISAVFTQEDRRRGRGLNVCPPPAKVIAKEYGIPVYQPAKLNSEDAVRVLEDLRPDVIVVVAYGQILSKRILDIPLLGCINVHASLLPRWRGAAPIHRAILEGDKETGITTMHVDVGLDTGDMILQQRIPIDPDETVGELHDRLAKLGGEVLLETLRLVEVGNAPRIPQCEGDATYASKITKEEGLIDWGRSSGEIHDHVRGLNPWPGAYTFLDGKLLKVWKVSPVDEMSAEVVPGCIARAIEGEGIVVQTGRGLLRIDNLQLEGRRELSGVEFQRGYEFGPETVLGK